jgi:hypothetical protein
VEPTEDKKKCEEKGKKTNSLGKRSRNTNRKERLREISLVKLSGTDMTVRMGW